MGAGAARGRNTSGAYPHCMNAAIARIKDAVSLPFLIGEYVKLRPVGKEHVAICPFHAEDTASMRVHAQYWHCFGCNAGGDAITFLAKIEGISTGDAIRSLSARTGIPLGATPTTKAGRVYDAEENAFAMWWWRRSVASLALRLSAYARLGTEEEAEAAGLLWRQMAAVKRQDVRAVVERCAGPGDRQEFRSIQQFDKDFQEAWFVIAKNGQNGNNPLQEATSGREAT